MRAIVWEVHTDLHTSTKKRGTSSPVPLICDISAQSKISISLPQQTGMGSPALICSVRLQI